MGGGSGYIMGEEEAGGGAVLRGAGVGRGEEWSADGGGG